MSSEDDSPPTLSDNGLDPDQDNLWPPFRVLKRADVDLKVGGKSKKYSVVIKVLPTDDPERHTNGRKFRELLKFSKEVQVYQNVIHSMMIYDEKRYPSACVEPPVPKCYLSQLDAQNDVLVLENLGFLGYNHYPKEHLADVDHCRVALRRMAHFHAISTLIQRDSEMSLCDLFPFAVDASSFRIRFQRQVSRVKEELSKYLLTVGIKGSKKGLDKEKVDNIIEGHLTDLFWKLVELRSLPGDRRFSVLIHGTMDPCNMVFQYDEISGRPICAKFLDFSSLAVSSPVIDITYFLHRAIHPEVATANHGLLLQFYHRAHTEAIESFGMHGYEMELETLLNEYQSKQDYGAMMGCLLRPAIYVLQCINRKEEETPAGQSQHHTMTRSETVAAAAAAAARGGGGGVEVASSSSTSSTFGAGKKKTPKPSRKNPPSRKKGGGALSTDDNLDGDDEHGDDTEDNIDKKTESSEGADVQDDLESDDPLRFKPTVPTDRLKIDRDLVPVDLRLHSYLSALAKSCPCPCSISGSRELVISELSADSLEDLHIQARQQDQPGLKTFDCSSGSTTSALKKLLLGLISHKDDGFNGTSAVNGSGGRRNGKD